MAALRQLLRPPSLGLRPSAAPIAPSRPAAVRPARRSVRRLCTTMAAQVRGRTACQAPRDQACQLLSGEGGVDLKQSWTIVGTGRIGSALAEMGENDVVVKRGEPVPDGGEGPIVVCTRNDDLQGVVDAVPEPRRGDLVFLQNGMIQPWLKERGLDQNTQVLVYFAVAKVGEPPADGKTDQNPEGLTAAWGPHAETFASRLHAHGLSCKVLDYNPFQQSMIEKLVWISAYMLVGVKHKVLVGEVEKSHHGEVEPLMRELAQAAADDLDIPMAAGLVRRLDAYSRSVADYPTALKEFPWRNGYFWALSQNAESQGKPDPCPLHSQLLKEVGAV